MQFLNQSWLEMKPRLGLSALSILLLASCGGGGGSSAPSSTVPDVKPVQILIGTECSSGVLARIVKESAPTAGRNTQIALVDCALAGNVANVNAPQWKQIDGAALNATSERSPALSVEPQSAGLYRYNVSFLDSTKKAVSSTVDLNVQAAAANQLNIRGEPSVWGEGQLSLRAWLPSVTDSQRATAKVTWSQVGGSTVTLDAPNSWNLVFKAPKVTFDTIVQMRASVSLADGTKYERDFPLLVQTPPNAASSPLFKGSSAATRVYPYIASSPYASVLVDCVYAPSITDSNLCPFSRLPILGLETAGADPTIEQIMQRVVVSNDWMGANFEQFLRQQDPNSDFRRLLKATTAIVIGGRINPSFYWSASGAIYLEGSYMWLTPEQRDTLSEAPDPRSNNGNALNYYGAWRYVLNNNYAGAYLPITGRSSRKLDDIKYELGSLLYHELTHANDALPPATHAGLAKNLQVWQASPSETPAQTLAKLYPFISDPMVALQRVNSFGATATPLQISYTSNDIAQFFARDRVTDEYSYSQYSDEDPPAEDPAMLIEEAMMQLRYGVLRDVAFTPKRLAGQSSSSLVVTWGQRGRIGEMSIRPRVKHVASQTMPYLDPTLFDKLAAPIALKAGYTWGQNLDQNAIKAGVPHDMNAQQEQREIAHARLRDFRRDAVSKQSVTHLKLH